MKLLLDEMYTYAIAEQLRARGHDVVAVGERPELRGTPDRDLFGVAQAEGRALVTDDVGYLQIEADHRSRGDSHRGLVLTSNRRFPRGRTRTVGALVRALDRFLTTDAVAYRGSASFTYWLR